MYLHATVVLQQRHQITILTDLILYIPHERTDTWFITAVWVSWHSSLQEVLLLWVFLQRHKELCDLILLLHTQDIKIILGFRKRGFFSRAVLKQELYSQDKLCYTASRR